MSNKQKTHEKQTNINKTTTTTFPTVFINVFDDVELSNITFKKSLKVSDKSSNIPIYYKNVDMLVQSPKMNLPFGISEYQNRKSLCMSFSNSGNDKEIILFLNFMKSISKLMYEKCKNIDKTTREFVDPFHKPNNYSHLLKLKMYHDKIKNQEIIQVYDHNKNLIQLGDIEKNTYVKTIIHISHIWYNDTKCGYECYVLQIKAYLHVRMLGTYAFIDNDEALKHIQGENTNNNTNNDTNNDTNNNTNNDTNNDTNGKIALKEHPQYKKYFRMLNYGVKLEQIKMQMVMEKLDSSVITQDPNTLVKLPPKNKKIKNKDNSDDTSKVDLSQLLLKKGNLKKTEKNTKKKSYKSQNMFHVGIEDVLGQINKLRKTNSNLID
jgi:hypothetical protein